MTATTLPAPFGPKYQERTADGFHGDECVLCGRRTGGKANTLMAHVVDGGTRFAADAEVEGVDYDTAGDMYWFPVGSECAKAFPAGYLTKGA